MKRKDKDMAKRIFAIVIILLFVTSTVATIFADGKMFTDVDDDYWAKPYIEDMVRKNVLSGYSDATFKPQKEVSRIEAIIMVANLFDKNTVESIYDKNKYKYESDLKKYAIPSWAQEETVYAMEEDIITSSKYLSTFVSNGKYMNVKKYEVPVFLVRALDMESELSGVNVLSFNDIDEIPKDAIPYIGLMIKKGVLGSKGDWKGNFNPNGSVTRGEMAKMLSVAYSLKKETSIPIDNSNNSGSSNSGSSSNKTDQRSDLEFIDGKIETVFEYNKIYTIAIMDSLGRKREFTNDENKIQVLLGNKAGDLSDIYTGMNVSLGIKEDKVYQVKAQVIDSEVEGNFDGTSFDSKNQYIRANVNKKMELYRIGENTKFKLDQHVATIYDIPQGARVEMRIEENVLKEVDAYSRKLDVKGYVEKIDVKKLYMEVELEDTNTTLRYDFDEDYDIERNGKKAEIVDIVKGDSVKLELKYGKISSINAKSVATDMDGSLRKIVISNTPQISIYDKRMGEERTFYLDRNFEVEINGEPAGLYDLRLNYQVEIEVENKKVIKISSDKETSIDTFTGKVVDIDTRDNTVEVRDEKTDKILYVSYNSDTKIENLDTSELKEGDIEEDDIVSVIGKDNIGSIEAIRITKIKSGD